MTFSDTLSLAALVISVLSPLIALHQIRLDRPKMKMTATFYPKFEGVEDHISLVVVNVGRRPIILRMLGGTDDDGHWAGQYIERDKGGKRLGEQERFEKILFWDDTCNST